LLYVFGPSENLIALLKPDFSKSTGPTATSQAFLGAEYPAEFDREPTEGCPYWDAIHHEVLNGENTLAFTVPADRADAVHVQEGNLVAFKDLDSYWQFFEIKRLVDLHGDGIARTAYCEHILYELIDDIVTDKRPSSTATAALAGMLENTRWNVGIVDDLGTAKTSAYYISALEAVQKVADAWKGELRWRCVVTGGVITRYVDLLAGRGADTGKQFAYTKDIVSIEREVDASNVVTALYGRGKGVELDSGAYGRRLTFADVVADDKPAGQEWIGDAEALARWGRPGGRHRFAVFTDEEETDAEALLEKTRVELAKRKVPRITYRLDVVSLEQVAGYEHEAVRIGDLVRVIDREFRPELVVSARVVELERDLLQPAKTKIVLGSFAPTIVDATINTQRQVSDLQNKPFNTAWLDGKISILQNEIENVSSYVFQTADDGILIMDAPTFAEATKAMKLGGGIFALANTKNGNQWNWRTFGDGAGFTADEINAGKIQAQFVQIGAGTTFDEGYDPSEVAGDLDTFISSTYAQDLADIHAQLDGKIETWFYEGPPTLSNAPAVDWTTDELKDQHIGDLYYDLLTGYAYRFLVDDGVYGWDPIVDTAVTQALALASLAKDTADNKRRVFVQTPTPPYDVGDLWAEGEIGDLKVCSTPKTAQESYDEEDWGLATKYTDDSTAAEALIAAVGAQETADGQIQGFFQPGAPSIFDEAIMTGDARFGDIWIDTDKVTPPDESCIYRCEDPNHGSSGTLGWYAAPTNAIGLVYLDAYLAKLEVDSVKDNLVYKVEIISSNGNVFKNGQIFSTLEARVYHGANDVTATIDANRFRWTRVSDDESGDASWNSAHFSGTKSVSITPSDVPIRATFQCSILSEE
jgi:phage minor structural protein